jgi:hypothetical protein
MNRRRRLLSAVWLALAVFCRAQPVSPAADEGSFAAAVRSPEALARFVESHRTIDWKSLRNALALKESPFWLAPCGSDFPAAESPCSTETTTVLNPDQAIVIIRGGTLSIEYLRYLKDPKVGWRFAGENNALQRNSPSHHEVVRLGDKPFLAISSDHSQVGVAIEEVHEDWFDLTQADFEPVFSGTVDGSQWRFGLGVGRTMHATINPSLSTGRERIDVLLDVQFDGVGCDQKALYLGNYERAANEKKFTLRDVHLLPGTGTPISPKDFEDLANPFSGLSNERLLVFALPGLEKIAVSSDPQAREWLRSILDHAANTPEKRVLLDLLGSR